MADEIPTVQILDKKNYFQQALVPFPDALPYPPLGPSSLRLRTSVLSLTVNNFTYAALGTLRNWWDVHPLPEGTPAPYNDGAKYGRISAWGYAEVLESTVPSIPRGSHLWGYVPLGTLAQDLEVRLHDDIPDQVFVTNGYRQHVMPIYNRYFVYAPSSSSSSSSSDRGAAIAHKTPAVAHDAILRVMHATAFLMADFVFSSSASRVVAPDGGPDDAWGAGDADLRDATVLIFAPGSKAAVIFASLLAQRRKRTTRRSDEKDEAAEEDEGRPRRIIGVSSEASRAFVQGTGVYDGVLLTSAADPVAAVADVVVEEDSGSSSSSSSSSGRKLVVFDFGGRAGVGPRWAAKLAEKKKKKKHPADKFLFVGVGSEVLDPSAVSQVAARARQAPPYPATRVNADDMRRRAIEKLGEERYWAEEGRSWEQFRDRGIQGLGVSWGEGMQDVVKGWDRLARGEVLPSEGLVYKL
ncbi:hypothetical protein F4782DRAFT_293939 [Xylaria castorea]|nr:hypothetical protein F4782DRAFT_293939 [Xylaria castorea]